VEDFRGTGPLRYYDAAARYFRALSALTPLRVDYVDVDGQGQSSRVISRAEALAASAIGIRVETPDDAARCARGSRPPRAPGGALSHGAVFPAGYALFGRVPEAGPRWRSGTEVSNGVRSTIEYCLQVPGNKASQAREMSRPDKLSGENWRWCAVTAYASRDPFIPLVSVELRIEHALEGRTVANRSRRESRARRRMRRRRMTRVPSTPRLPGMPRGAIALRRLSEWSYPQLDESFGRRASAPPLSAPNRSTSSSIALRNEHPPVRPSLAR
jgi:hypothetical protein